MKTVIKIFGFMILGVALAVLVGPWLPKALGINRHIGQQAIIILVLTTGALFAGNISGIKEIAKKTFSAWFLYCVVQVAALVWGLMNVHEFPVASDFIGKALMAFGWYPRGADAWLPLGVIIWTVTTFVVVLTAVILVGLIKALSRKRLQ